MKAFWGLMRSTVGSSSSSFGGSCHTVNELKMYIQMGPIEVLDDEDDFALLTWWKSYETKFSVLFAMSRDILTVPTSTVASE